MRCVGLILFLVAARFVGVSSAFADEFDTLRGRWRERLTLGTDVNPADPHYSGWISGIQTVAQNHWRSMKTNAARSCLWNDLNQLNTRSADLTSTYERLRAMALGYSVHGSVLESNPGLRDAVITGLDWMATNYYNETQTEYDNWFDWEIGVPLNLNDLAVLLYESLTAAQLAQYLNAIDHFTPTPDLTGANRVWKAAIVAVRGATGKSAAKLEAGRQALSDVFPYVTSGDGFYPDGSFVFHSFVPYNGGYGAQLIGTLAPLMQWLQGSSWEVTDPRQTNLFRWIYDSFAPFIYQGALMPMVTGRYYTRSGDDHLDGHEVMDSILRIAQFAPSADAAAYRGLLKHWLQTDRYRDFVGTEAPPFNLWAEAVLNDPNVAPSGEAARHYQFPQMDRVVQLRPGWGLGLAMSSSRIANFESIRGENLRGWYTGDGATYLYNADLGQFADQFWPTVNPYRVPGTTVDTQPRSNGSGAGYLSPNTWAGGASLQNLHGVAGMELNAWSSTLKAKKSWFMFDEEIVCLGAGISSTDNRTIETVVENRQLAGYGNNEFIVNGAPQPAAVGWADTLTNVSWAHLRGNVPGADIGYFFPQPATLQALREARSGSLANLNNAYGTTNLSTRSFLTLWFDHGVNPANATYAYVLLPNQTAAQAARYAAGPCIQVLENSSRAQGVRQSALGITAVNFWKDGTNRLGGVTVDRKASVIVRNDGTILDLGVSDPTQTNTSVINLEINVPASASLSVDPSVIIGQLKPTVRLTVNVQGAAGQTRHGRFFIGPVQTLTLGPSADAYVQNGDQTNSNFGAAQTLAVKAAANLGRETYLRFSLPPAPGMIFNATLRLVPITVNDPGLNHALALVSDHSWTETGLTWNNKPLSDPEFTRWALTSAGTPIAVPVTSLAQQAAATDGILALRVYSTATPPPTNGFAAYASRENGALANRAQLIVSLGRVPPILTLNQPTNGAMFDAPATIGLVADVPGPDGSITNVDFSSVPTKLAQLRAGPYAVTLTNLPAGEYAVMAVATDITGLMATSAPVTISVYRPQPPGRGTGLIGQYYTNQNLTGLALTRTDPTVNFDWGFAAPAPALPADRFSVRWRGKLQARHAGLHQFHTVSDEAVRLWIDGQLLIDHWTDHTATEDTGAIALIPGQYYDLTLEYGDYVGPALAQLFWTPPGGTKEIIPSTQLYPANSGLTGDYFSGTNFARLVFSRPDDSVNFSWGESSPDPARLPGSFSVRWTGKVWANQSGPFAFSTLSDDGVRLWVNHQLLINDWTVHPTTENTGTISLVGGRYYDLTLEYFAVASGATAALFWAPPGGSKQIVPQTNLTPNQNNHPPVLAVIPYLILSPSHPLAFPVTATDPDTPAQSLIFTLDSGGPAGASINATNGLLTWAPATTWTPGNYPLTVRVTDNGTPLMTDAEGIILTLVPDRALTLSRSEDHLALSWPVDAGSVQVYTTTNLLLPGAWTRLSSTPVLSNGQFVLPLPDAADPARFFRLQTE